MFREYTDFKWAVSKFYNPESNSVLFPIYFEKCQALKNQMITIFSKHIFCSVVVDWRLCGWCETSYRSLQRPTASVAASRRNSAFRTALWSTTKRSRAWVAFTPRVQATVSIALHYWLTIIGLLAVQSSTASSLLQAAISSRFTNDGEIFGWFRRTFAHEDASDLGRWYWLFPIYQRLKSWNFGDDKELSAISSNPHWLYFFQKQYCWCHWNRSTHCFSDSTSGWACSIGLQLERRTLWEPPRARSYWATAERTCLTHRVRPFCDILQQQSPKFSKSPLLNVSFDHLQLQILSSACPLCDNELTHPNY